METRLPEDFRRSSEGQEAERILRSCVHCGFCTATCPTYGVLGDELDGPRGRIYLIKQMLEQGRAGAQTREHLDRCLLCRSCETTCPSGVEYHRLLEIGRKRLEGLAPLPLQQRLLRGLLLRAVPMRHRIGTLLRLGRWVAPLLPAALRHKLYRPRPGSGFRARPHARRVVLFQGCVEPAALPAAREAALRLLDALGVRGDSLAGEQCCGALEHHLQAEHRARHRARRNLDLWRRALDEGAEAILGLSSACVLEIHEYPDLLRDEPEYLALAQRVLSRVQPFEVWLEGHWPVHWGGIARGRVAWHPPCTLQHGLRAASVVPNLLRRAGFEVLLPADSHLCCGAAGTYSLFQPAMSERLREDKLAALQALEPEVVASANVGCLMHLEPAAAIPVRHWVEVLAEAVPPDRPAPPRPA